MIASGAIRPLEAGDLPGVLDLWESLVANGRAADPRFATSEDARDWMERWARADWLLRDPFPHAWVAGIGGEAIGWIDGFPHGASPILVGPAVAHVGNLWVEPAHRRAGIGRALVEAFASAAAAAGYPVLEVGTLALDTRAVRFWTAMGFDPWKVELRREVARPSPTGGLGFGATR